MKIIVSPAKTQQWSKQLLDIKNRPEFLDESVFLREEIKKLSKEEIAVLMKIKGKKLDEVFELFSKDIDDLEEVPAVECYTGFVFKELNIDDYKEKQVQFMEENLVILSAMYGALRPLDGMKPYRLDMTMKPLEKSLYEFWRDKIDLYFQDQELIVNLASNEFSKMISKEMITIEFKVIKEGKIKTIGTYAKKARGMMLDYIIKHEIKDVENMKNFNRDGYKFSEENSSTEKLMFIKEL